MIEGLIGFLTRFSRMQAAQEARMQHAYVRAHRGGASRKGAKFAGKAFVPRGAPRRMPLVETNAADVRSDTEATAAELSWSSAEHVNVVELHSASGGGEVSGIISGRPVFAASVAVACVVLAAAAVLVLRR